MNLPPGQAFIRMYGYDGKLLRERKFTATGNNTGTSGKDVSLDDKAIICHVGLTGGNLFGTMSWEGDVYLVRTGLDAIFQKIQ